jgi:hypothetical protein
VEDGDENGTVVATDGASGRAEVASVSVDCVASTRFPP